MNYFVSILTLVVAASASSVTFINRCNYGVSVIRTENNRAPALQAQLNPGQSIGASFGSNGMNFKNGWNGQTLAEFSFNSWNGMDFYDLSVIVGFDTPMQIQSNKGQWVTCTYKQCPDAYQYPTDDTKTHGVPTGGSFSVVFCP